MNEHEAAASIVAIIALALIVFIGTMWHYAEHPVPTPKDCAEACLQAGGLGHWDKTSCTCSRP